jgi:hypothetical protein
MVIYTNYFTPSEKVMKILVIILLLLLSSCATKINHPPAPQEQIDKAQNFEIKKGTAKVYFFLGKAHMGSTEGGQLNEAMDLFINEKKFVTLGNQDEYAVVDLSPGSYSFKCKAISTGSGIATPVPLEMRIENGELIFLAANFFAKTPGAAFLLGPLGAMANDYSYAFVRDDNLKQTIGKYKLISSDEPL